MQISFDDGMMRMRRHCGFRSPNGQPSQSEPSNRFLE
jgi:hypothetical protein